MPLMLLVAIFIVIPIAELYVIIQVGGLIGVPETIVLLILDSIIGSWLLRSQGRAAWRRFTQAMEAGRIPHQEATDGGLVIFGGALLLTPGFITDIFGLLLLIPPTRAVARRILAAAIKRRVVVAVGAQPPTGPPTARREYDVEGTATETGTSAPDSRLPRLES
jgi:UPF0716 protein FxsA